MIEDRVTIVVLVVVGVVSALVGGKVTYDHYLQDKVDNCVLDNLRELRRSDPIGYRYTSVADLPGLREHCMERVYGN